MEELQEKKKNQLWCTSMKEQALKVINKPLEELQKDEVKALLCHHGVEKSTLTKKTVVQMRQQCHQLKVDLMPKEHPTWTEDNEASLTSMRHKVIDLTDTSTKLGAERKVVWQEHKQTVENCCKLHDDEAKSELIEMLSKSMEEGVREPESIEGGVCEPEPEASSKPVEPKASSDDETIIPDNTQARILCVPRNQKDASTPERESMERKVKSKLIEMLLEPVEPVEASDDKTIIPDNTQACVPGLRRSTRSRKA